MNVLITDYYCASNRGDAAILEGVYRSLASVYPDAEITVMTEHPLAAELVHGIGAAEQLLTGFRWGLSKQNAARAYLSATSPLLARGRTPPGFESLDRRANVRPYLEADLVVSTGGQFLTDVYFPEKVGVLWEHDFCSRIDTPVVLYAQSLGPFDRPLYRRLTKRVLDDVALIVTRDERSRAIVEELGADTPTFCTADAAFSMSTEAPDSTPLDALAANDRLPGEGETTVSVSVREWRHAADTGVDDYARAVADVADWLVAERDATVVFASTCTGLAGYHTDDRLLAATIVDRMDADRGEDVRVLAGEYTPAGLVEVYRQMDLHIGMRMHSNVLAMLAGTPVAAIGYQFKTRGLLEQFGLSEYLLDVEAVDADRLRRLVGEAFDERDSLAETVRAELPAVREESRRSARLVDDHVDVPN